MLRTRRHPVSTTGHLADHHPAGTSVETLTAGLESLIENVLAFLRKDFSELLRLNGVLGNVDDSFHYGLYFHWFHIAQAVSFSLEIWISSNAFFW